MRRRASILLTVTACASEHGAPRERLAAGGRAGTAAAGGSAAPALGGGGMAAGSAGTSLGGGGGVGLTSLGGGSSAGGPPETAGSAAAGTAGVPAAGSGGSGGASAAAGAPATCPVTTPSDPAAATLHLPIELAAGDTPLVLGQEFVTQGGGGYLPGVVSFFVSQVVLTSAAGERVRAHLTDAAGSPRPYDVLLVNASDPTSLALDVRAPPGTYAALELGIGLPPSCNHGDPTQAVFPLNASTGFYWTWATGYMFIRIEGQLTAGETFTPFSYHVGFDDLYRTVVLMHPFSVPSTDTTERITFDLNRVMAAANAAPGDLTLATELEVADRFASPGTLTVRP